MLNSVEDIIDLHESEGKIEDAYVRLHFDNKIMILNKYTLRARRGNLPREEIREWNNDIYTRLKKDRNLKREIREFISVMELFERLKIKSGYIKKAETPDFVLTRNGTKVGIEITKIYIGNDWVADKLNEEVKEFRLRKSDLDGYMEYKKYKEKVTTYTIREGLAILPNTDSISAEDYIVELKNKIFTKIRKLSDSYDKFPLNIIYVDIVSSRFLKDKLDLEKMNEEFKFFISHIESDFENMVSKVIMKLGNEFVEFNLTDNTYKKF